MSNHCIFLDRDGVINKERGDYTYQIEDFEIMDGVMDGLEQLKSVRYKLIIITNQAGITRKRYTREQMYQCHQYLHNITSGIIDDIYYSPYHPLYSESLTRKPDSLMLEKAIAKHHINPLLSWMIGDNERDLIPAKKLKMRTILLSDTNESAYADFQVSTFAEAVQVILSYYLN